MKRLVKTFFTISIILFANGITAQEWSSRISIVQEHLTEFSITEKEDVPNKLELGLLQSDGDAFTINTEHFSSGINIMFEEVLESGFSIKDMVVYNLGMTYIVGKFGLYFTFENFFNAGQQESGILPIPEYYDSHVVTAVLHEIDTPYSVMFGITFTF